MLRQRYRWVLELSVVLPALGLIVVSVLVPVDGLGEVGVVVLVVS
jgi:hypothetical protein